MDVGNIIGAAGFFVAVVTLFLTGEWQRIRWLAGAFKRRPEVVIGVVIHQNQALVVHRKPQTGSSLHWQFPSAFVRSESELATKIKSEILNETGIVVDVENEIGRRTHPTSGRRCVYMKCHFISGAAANLDVIENIDVRWVPCSEVEAYFGGRVYGKVRSLLQ